MPHSIISFTALLAFIMIAVGCQYHTKKLQLEQQSMIVQTACGECQFGLAGNDCDLAVRINKKAYFVDGTGIDDHGDAHSDDGFCNTIRQARVQGHIVKDRFLVTSFKLLPKQ